MKKAMFFLLASVAYALIFSPSASAEPAAQGLWGCCGDPTVWVRHMCNDGTYGDLYFAGFINCCGEGACNAICCGCAKCRDKPKTYEDCERLCQHKRYVCEMGCEMQPGSEFAKSVCIDSCSGIEDGCLRSNCPP